MVKLNYSHTILCDERKFWENLTNFTELPKYLSRQIQKIEILEENDQIIILNMIIFVRSLIKKEFSVQIKVIKKEEKELFLEVLDGFTKGTQSTISISTNENYSICEISIDVKFSLKTMIFIPIIKKEYEGILIKIFRNMEREINEEMNSDDND